MASEHKVNRMQRESQTKQGASMNTASKNNWDNVIGVSSSLVQRRIAELHVQLVKQKAVTLKRVILSKHNPFVSLYKHIRPYNSPQR